MVFALQLMLRTLLIIVWIILATLFFAPLAILASFISKNENNPHKIGRIWAMSILMASGVKVFVKGESNIHPTGSYIYMANHLSNFDIPVLMAYLPVQFRWLAKSELFEIPLFGYAMKRAGYISIDRSNREAAIQSLSSASKIIKNGVSVLIFPEGTRSKYNNLQPFKKGGFVMAVDSGIPIIPVVIHGTWAIMPKNKIQIKPGKVLLEVSKPVETFHYTKKTKGKLMEKVRNIILKSHEKDNKGVFSC